MDPGYIYCSKCGNRSAAGTRFCSKCGTALRQPAAQPPVQQVQQPVYQAQPVQQVQQPVRQAPPVQQYAQTQPVYAQPVYAQPVYAQPAPAAVAVKKKKSPFGLIIAAVALLLVVTLIVTGFIWPAFVPKIVRKLTPAPDYFNNGFSDSGKVSASSETKIGDIKKNGVQLEISKGAFATSTNIRVDVMKGSEAESYKSDDCDVIGSVVTVSADDYDGKYFAEPVVLSMDLPVSQMDDSTNSGQYFAAYYDEGKKTWMLLQPDYINVKNGRVKLRLINLPDTGGDDAPAKTIDKSFIGPLPEKMAAALDEYGIVKLAGEKKKGKVTLAFVKPDEKKTAEQYLDDWCNEKARQETLEEEGKEAFQPYVKAIAEKMAATKEARNAMIEAITGKLISGMNTDSTKGKLVAGSLDMANSVGWGAYRALESGDSSEFTNALGTATAKALTQCLTDDGDYVNFVGAAGSIGQIAGQIEGGDYAGAAQTTTDAVLGFFPTANMIDKTSKYVVRKIDMDYTMWKKDRIDDLYVKWRDGFETHPGKAYSIEYKAQDFDELMEYLDYDTHSNESGMGNADMMLKRIYDSDQKIDEQVERYGFGHRTYKSLSDEEKDQFAKRVTHGLEEYFKQRLKNEQKAEKMKANEAEFMNELIEFGYFDDTRFNKFFGDGDEYRPYNAKDRLDKIYQVRKMLAKWVDPAKQKKEMYDDAYLVTEFVCYREEGSLKEAQIKMLKWLKEKGLLKDGIKVPESSEVTVDDIVGTWAVRASFTDVESWFLDWLQDVIKDIVAAISEELGDLSGDTSSVGDLDYKDKLSNVSQTITIKKISDNRVSALISGEEGEGALYEGTLNDKGVLSLTLKKSAGSDDTISIDIQKLEYRFYKTNGYVRMDGSYDIRSIAFNATYYYYGDKLYDSEVRSSSKSKS